MITHDTHHTQNVCVREKMETMQWQMWKTITRKNWQHRLNIIIRKACTISSFYLCYICIWKRVNVIVLILLFFFHSLFNRYLSPLYPVDSKTKICVFSFSCRQEDANVMLIWVFVILAYALHYTIPQHEHSSLSIFYDSIFISYTHSPLNFPFEYVRCFSWRYIGTMRLWSVNVIAPHVFSMRFSAAHLQTKYGWLL